MNEDCFPCLTGRKEILLFFYIYFLISLLAIFLDSAIIPTANVVYPVSYRNRSNTAS